MSLYIRHADINDCEALGIIHSESWKVTYRGIVPDLILDNMTAKKSEEKFYYSISHKEGKTVLALKDNMPAGFMCLGRCRDEDLKEITGEIWGIYLMPYYFRQGIGKELLYWGINYLKDEGFNKISLWVLEENINARNFYERMGFVHDGKINELNIGKPLNEFRYIKIVS